MRLPIIFNWDLPLYVANKVIIRSRFTFRYQKPQYNNITIAFEYPFVGKERHQNLFVKNDPSDQIDKLYVI
jgi:hypothetical protein